MSVAGGGARGTNARGRPCSRGAWPAPREPPPPAQLLGPAHRAESLSSNRQAPSCEPLAPIAAPARRSLDQRLRSGIQAVNRICGPAVLLLLLLLPTATTTTQTSVLLLLLTATTTSQGNTEVSRCLGQNLCDLGGRARQGSGGSGGLRLHRRFEALKDTFPPSWKTFFVRKDPFPLRWKASFEHKDPFPPKWKAFFPDVDTFPARGNVSLSEKIGILSDERVVSAARIGSPAGRIVALAAESWSSDVAILRGHAGMLIFAGDRQRPEYLPWTDVERIDLGRLDRGR